MTVYVEERGAGEAVLLLLHGMSCTGAVWRPLVDALAGRWNGRIVVVDLPGHGASDSLAEYTYESVTSAVAAAVPVHHSLVVVGHSFGGAIATHLASGRFGVQPTAVIAAGVKVVWTADELAGAAALAQKPARWFETREEAEDRYRKVAGLSPDAGAALIERGVVEEDGRFRLSADPQTSGIGDPQLASVVAAARCPILLGRGERDHMVSADDLAALGAPVFDIAGAGHNLHVDQPAALAAIVADFARLHSCEDDGHA